MPPKITEAGEHKSRLRGREGGKRPRSVQFNSKQRRGNLARGSQMHSEHCSCSVACPMPGRRAQKRKRKPKANGLGHRQQYLLQQPSQETSPRRRSACRWEMSYTALATQISSWLPGGEKSKNKTGNSAEKRESMRLKASLAPRQGAQHLPGRVSEQLVWVQAPSFGARCSSLRCRCRLRSSRTLKHTLELQLQAQAVRRDSVPVLKCEQH